MPATPERIGFITNEFRTSVVTDAAVKAKYGEAARDTGDEPVESFFTDPAHAAVMNSERLGLLSLDRRRFRQDVAQILSFTGSLDISQVTPAANVIDDERSANHNGAIVEIGVRYGDDKSTIVTWG